MINYLIETSKENHKIHTLEQKYEFLSSILGCVIDDISNIIDLSDIKERYDNYGSLIYTGKMSEISFDYYKSNDEIYPLKLNKFTISSRITNSNNNVIITIILTDDVDKQFKIVYSTHFKSYHIQQYINHMYYDNDSLSKKIKDKNICKMLDAIARIVSPDSISVM